ncbi:protein 5NUC-like [Cylas formicarius]|uniref:protein 5NUC-like n=1 Tax=Cylas formicarius TaxID=197179 RepID=UPI0029583962|nr:protein 5NUC-like [Cylas formicarius]
MFERDSVLVCALVVLVAKDLYVVGGVPIKRAAEELSMILLHNNDMHGRFDETERNSGSCQVSNRNKSCIGGFARTAHVIRKYRQKAKEGIYPPVLYLNAGDTFVGTSWFSVFTWNISSAFINILEPDALSLGNHEFDLTVGTLAPFVDAVKSPILAANLDLTGEPSLSKVKKSVILEVSGWQVGIIGYLTPETIKISSVGSIKFEDEVEAIKRESTNLQSLGVNIIIALGHSGYLTDQKIAEEVELVDVVIGGHSNTFLWNGKQPDYEPVEDPYPKIITQKSGKKVPVVQAYAYTKYLGVLNVTFDDKGDLISFAGQPILLESSIPQDEDVLALLDVYRPKIDALNEEEVGVSKVILDGSDAVCRRGECNLGNLITDALVSYVVTVSPEQWTAAPLGLYNGGGIRNTIDVTSSNGKITRGDLLGVLPYGNQVVQKTLKGVDLIRALEQGARGNGETSYGEFPQVSGMKVVLDMSKPPYSRVVSVKVRCGLCLVPIYEPLDPHKNYTLVTSSFLSDGGDGITALRDNFLDKKVHDLTDIDTVAWYIRKYSPVYPEVQGRITFVNGSECNSNGAFKSRLSWTVFVIGFLLSFLNYVDVNK